nr:shikimate dehydrogenase [Desulfobacterales bacterium]
MFTSEIDAKTQIYGIIGNPVEHSMSPLIHNLAFRRLGMNAVYLPFLVQDIKGAIYGIRAFQIRGMSITIPFKTEIIKYIDEIDDTARAIGAINTIRFTEDRITGFNTDWLGVVRSIQEFLPIKDRKFVVLGAGGAARAVLFGLKKEGGNPIIVNRTPAKGEMLSREFECPFFPLNQIDDLQGDCLINTTPVGMFPDIDKSPVPGKVLSRFGFVLDIIYNPLKTKLLKEAEKRGAVAINGVKMFVYQGAEQFKAWTGKEPPVKEMENAVLKQLSIRSIKSEK